jgi:hypothetical protein
MKTMRSAILCFVVLLLAAPIIRAQDFSKYRNFSLGTSLATVLKHTNQKLTDVKVAQIRPALLQELSWWPPSIPGAAYQADSVQEMLFSFYNGELYKICVAYERSSTEGFTADDMVKSISAKYGPPSHIALEIDSTKNEQYEARLKPVASWEDSQNAFDLGRSTFSGDFQLLIYSKQVNMTAEIALAEALQLDKQEGPQREAARLKKETDDSEVTRQKNQKIFRP